MGGQARLEVSDFYTGIDHSVLGYYLQRGTRKVKNTITRRWAPATFDQNLFLCVLKGVMVEGAPEEKARSIMRAVTAA